MNLDEVAKKLGYVDADHLEKNIYNYGEPLPEWWEVIKELVNKLPLNDVIVSAKDCKLPMREFGSDKCLICGKKVYEH